MLLFLIILNDFEVNNWWLLRLLLIHAPSSLLCPYSKMSLQIPIALAVILAAVEVLEVDLAAGTRYLLVLVYGVVLALPGIVVNEILAPKLIAIVGITVIVFCGLLLLRFGR